MAAIPAITLLSPLLILLLLLLIASSPLSVSSARCDAGDKKALLSIKASFGDYLRPWDSPTTGCCAWYGVDCDPATGRVTGLSFFQTTITGSLPHAIGDLSFLASIDIRKSPNLTGPIPESIGKLTRLTFLRLDWNALTGPIPSSLSRLPVLYYLNLSFNRLSGSIPPSLSALPAVVYIRLDRNRLTGSIPAALSGSRAASLYLSHNNLTGAVPSSFATARFEVLDLSRNRLSGDASVLFGAKKPLHELDLSRNSFGFDLTGVEFPENMTVLDLNHNMVRGGIPPGIAGLDGLTGLNLTYNRLCGEIPAGGRLAQFDEYSYVHNRCLCGPPLDVACK